MRWNCAFAMSYLRCEFDAENNLQKPHPHKLCRFSEPLPLPEVRNQFNSNDFIGQSIRMEKRGISCKFIQMAAIHNKNIRTRWNYKMFTPDKETTSRAMHKGGTEHKQNENTTAAYAASHTGRVTHFSADITIDFIVGRRIILFIFSWCVECQSYIDFSIG